MFKNKETEELGGEVYKPTTAGGDIDADPNTAIPNALTDLNTNTIKRKVEAPLKRITQLLEKTTKVATPEVEKKKKPTMDFNMQTDISAG